MRQTHHDLELNLGSEILGFEGDDDDFNGLGLEFGLLRDRNVLDSSLTIMGTLFYFCKVRRLYQREGEGKRAFPNPINSFELGFYFSID